MSYDNLKSKWAEPRSDEDQKPVIKGGCCDGGDLTLAELYERAVQVPGDLNEHVPTLREYAERVDHVTEFGHRHGASSVALLMAYPRRFVTYDIADDPLLERLKDVADTVAYEFKRGSSLEVDIEETDMLFLDTEHNAKRLDAELARHAGKVSRYIALHDTKIYGERGDDGGPGLLPAMRRFMSEQPEWSVVYHAINNNGFTVLSRNPKDKPTLPGKIEMASNFAQALASHVADGMRAVDNKELTRRLEICSICTHRNGTRCSVCGCPVEKKAAWNDQFCPIGKWNEGTDKQPQQVDDDA